MMKKKRKWVERHVVNETNVFFMVLLLYILHFISLDYLNTHLQRNIQETIMSKEQNTPQYIKQLPWYAKNQSGVGESINTPSFIPKTQLEIQWYERGKKGYQAITFRKGACVNCGAMGHTKKQCTERPRKITANFTNRSIAPDDVVKDLKLNWQGKRDRWNGYDADMYKEVIEEFEDFEQVRKKRRIEEGSLDPDSEYKVSTDPMALATLPSKYVKNQKYEGLMGVRNREDRAKYLINLDLNGPQFDPKSRSMKNQDDPYSLGQLNNISLLGQKLELTEQDKFADQQVEKNNSELSSISLPTLTEKIFKTVKQKNQSSNSGKIGQLMQKYGANSQYFGKPIGVIVQEEDDPSSFVNKSFRNTVKSSYLQDKFINDHVSVWGSWYNKLLGWGYSCCHSTQKMSYCLGSKGKEKAVTRQLKLKVQMLSQLNQIEEKQKEEQQEEQKEVKEKEQQQQ